MDGLRDVAGRSRACRAGPSGRRSASAARPLVSLRDDPFTRVDTLSTARASDSAWSRGRLIAIGSCLALVPPTTLAVAAVLAPPSRAQAAIAEFRASDHDPIASVVRRPLHRMVEDLGAFAPTAA